MTTPIVLRFPPPAAGGPLAAFSSIIDKDHGTEPYALGPIRKLNLFLGGNNSGKSRLLRALSAMPVRRCIADAARQRIESLVICLRALAREAAFNKRSIAHWALYPDILGGYPSVGLDQLADLEWRFETLMKRPGLLWAFVGFLRSYRAWLEKSFPGTSVSLARCGHHLDEVSKAAVRENLYELPQGSESLLSSDDQEFVSKLANDPFVRMACLAGRAKSLSLTSPVGRVDSDAFAVFHDLMNRLAEDMVDVGSPSVYIPVLRTAHIFELGQDEDIYRAAMQRFYGVENVARGANSGLRREVFTGMDLYRRFLSDRSGSRERRKRFEAFEEFIGKAFFGGQTVDVVAQYAPSGEPLEAHHIKVTIDDDERELHHLGDGIQALIILLYPMFMAEPDTWFFIDEPEIHLHPGFQRLFLETLMTNEVLSERNLRYFFTTHSNHFFDPLAAFANEVSVFSMAQVSVAQVSKKQFSIAWRQAPSVKELDLLGVRNASVLLANCTVWVEGITDRLYLRVYLKAYAEAEGFGLREDLHYAFLEYGGSNIAHYIRGGEDPLMRQIEPAALSNRALVIADLDQGEIKTKAHAERGKAFSASGVAYTTTAPCVEIENTLSVGILREVFADEFERLWPRRLKGLDLSKVSFDPDKLVNIRMGTYLQDLFGSQVPGLNLVTGSTSDSEAEAESSGKTLATEDKTALAKKVCELSAAGKINWNMLSPAARDLTVAVVEHIRRSNGLGV